MSARAQVLLLLGVLSLALFASVGTSSAASAKRFSVSDPSSFPGSDWDSDENIRVKRSAVLRTAKSVGATHLRIWVWWADLHSCNADRHRNLLRVLTSIQQARAAGLEPMISFAGVSATWGFPCDGHATVGLNPDPRAYANFVSYVSAHTMRAPYNVRIYETYNEPDHPSFLCELPKSMKLRGGRRAPLVVKYEPKGSDGGDTENGDVVGEQVIPYGYYDLGNGRVKRKACAGMSVKVKVRVKGKLKTVTKKPGLSKAAAKHRKLHSKAVYALRRNAAIIGLTRSDLTILFGDTTAQSLDYMGWALRDMRKLDADGIAIHSYWSKKSDKMPTKCDPKKTGRRYLGMECLGQLRALIKKKARKVPSKKDMPIWVTEGGLWVGAQQNDHKDNVKLAMDNMRKHAVMVNWYHIMESKGWETWITDIYGSPTKAAQRLHAWAKARGFKASPNWLAPAPGLVKCADGSMPDVTVPCPMQPAVAPNPPVPAGSWVIYTDRPDH